MLLVPSSSLPWPFLPQFMLPGHTLAVQGRKHSAVAEEGWPDLSSAFTTAAVPFAELPDKLPCPFLQAESGSSGMTLLFVDKSRCSETEGDSDAEQQIASAEPDMLPSEGLLSGYA